jgi:hypothetical protein
MKKILSIILVYSIFLSCGNEKFEDKYVKFELMGFDGEHTRPIERKLTDREKIILKKLLEQNMWSYKDTLGEIYIVKEALYDEKEVVFWGISGELLGQSSRARLTCNQFEIELKLLAKELKDSVNTATFSKISEIVHMAEKSIPCSNIDSSTWFVNDYGFQFLDQVKNLNLEDSLFNGIQFVFYFKNVYKNNTNLEAYSSELLADFIESNPNKFLNYYNEIRDKELRKNILLSVDWTKVDDINLLKRKLFVSRFYPEMQRLVPLFAPPSK